MKMSAGPSLGSILLRRVRRHAGLATLWQPAGAGPAYSRMAFPPAEAAAEEDNAVTTPGLPAQGEQNWQNIAAIPTGGFGAPYVADLSAGESASMSSQPAPVQARGKAAAAAASRNLPAQAHTPMQAAALGEWELRGAMPSPLAATDLQAGLRAGASKPAQTGDAAPVVQATSTETPKGGGALGLTESSDWPRLHAILQAHREQAAQAQADPAQTVPTSPAPSSLKRDEPGMRDQPVPVQEPPLDAVGPAPVQGNAPAGAPAAQSGVVTPKGLPVQAQANTAAEAAATASGAAAPQNLPAQAEELHSTSADVPAERPATRITPSLTTELYPSAVGPEQGKATAQDAPPAPAQIQSLPPDAARAMLGRANPAAEDAAAEANATAPPSLSRQAREPTARAGADFAEGLQDPAQSSPAAANLSGGQPIIVEQLLQARANPAAEAAATKSGVVAPLSLLGQAEETLPHRSDEVIPGRLQRPTSSPRAAAELSARPPEAGGAPNLTESGDWPRLQSILQPPSEAVQHALTSAHPATLMEDRPGMMGRPAPVQALPLEAAWPVQRLGEAAPSPGEAVELLPPRGPRPTAVQRAAENRPEKPPEAQGRAAAPTPGDQESQTPVMVPTGIGELPADLWTLLGETPPAAPAEPQRAAGHSAPPAPADTAAVDEQMWEPLGGSIPEGLVQAEAQDEAAAEQPHAETNPPTAAAEAELSNLVQHVYAEIRRRLALEWERSRR